jgi:hypothetical protein
MLQYFSNHDKHDCTQLYFIYILEQQLEIVRALALVPVYLPEIHLAQIPVLVPVPDPVILHQVAVVVIAPLRYLFYRHAA